MPVVRGLRLPQPLRRLTSFRFGLRSLSYYSLKLSHRNPGVGLSPKRTFILATVAVLVLAACGGGNGGDVDTEIGAPGPTTTMAGMAGAGGEHAEHGGAAPEAGATPDCSPTGANVMVVASSTQFNSACYAAPANQSFTITYDNRDTLSHNIVILESHAATEAMFRAEIFTGPRTSTFTVPALRPGTFAFHCEVHPTLMRGTFIVK